VLQLVPESWLTWNYDLLDGDRLIAGIRVSSLPESGTFSIDGSSYSARRAGIFSGEYTLELNGQIIARAQKPSAFVNSFEIQYSDKRYALKKESFIGRSFVLLDGDRQIGSIQAKGFLSRKADVELPEEIPLPIKVFILWLGILLWRREANASSETTQVV